MTLLAFSGGAIQLVPDGTLLFHLALIVVMVSVLNATLLKPINRILEERERRTSGRLGEAQQVLTSIDEKMLEYQRRLREARGNGYTLMEEERSAAAREREQKVSAVKEEAARLRDQEKAKLANDEAAVRETLMVDARVRAAEISARIIGRQSRSL
ncbi:MAG TPA: ATP synthase F0 subunit B [Pyrinomonadaceae bacterium]|nr:ATP synthase F0 subunit B [Pyrinomonadaceae bacterium]